MKFQTPFSKHTEGVEVYNKQSVTVPDQSYTIVEMCARFTQGLPIRFARDLTYTGTNAVYPDVRKMDLVDVQQMQETLHETIEETKKEIERKRELRKQNQVSIMEKQLEAAQKLLEEKKNQIAKEYYELNKLGEDSAAK